MSKDIAPERITRATNRQEPKNTPIISFLVLLITFTTIIHSCIKPGSPQITTKAVTGISFSTATSGGDVISDGQSQIIKKGVCWNCSGNPTVNDTKTVVGNGSGSFTCDIKMLTPYTTYYIKAYAENGEGIGYGEQLSFTTLQPVVPVLTTSDITLVTQTSAVSGGNITSDNDGSIIERGICFDTKPNPTGLFRTIDGKGTGTFLSNLTNLLPGNTYYARAYAKTVLGYTYGNEISFTTLPVTDIDGNSYKTIGIGDQIWMEENLKTTRYNDGTSIPLVINNTEWSSLITGGYCWYNNDPANQNTYGVLYNWYVVKTEKICPIGWHVPKYEEIETLYTYLGGKNVAGGKLKETGSTYWHYLTYPNIGATNETGFSALPGGYRANNNGLFASLGESGRWWLSTSYPVVSTSGEYVPPNAGTFEIYYNNSSLYLGIIKLVNGVSIRCLSNTKNVLVPKLPK